MISMEKKFRHNNNDHVYQFYYASKASNYGLFIELSHIF